jgi:long-chain acyl-CoA synthetase
LAFLPWAHCYGQTCELHSGISLGTRIAIAESVDKLPENLQQVRPNKLFSVPSLFNKIQQNVKQQMESSSLKNLLISKAREYSKINREAPNWLNTQKYRLMDKLVLSKIRDKLGGQLDHCFTGGAAMSLEVLELFEDLGIPIIEGYGLSETTPIITLNEIDYPVRKLGSVGKILDNLEVQLVDQEIWVHGPSVMKGYHNNPAANDQVFEYLDGKKFFKTGDLGSFDDQGRLYITGRRKEQYKLENGKYVVPNVVEGHLGLSPLFKYVIMYGHNQEYNILIVVANEDILQEELTKQKIIQEGDNDNILDNPAVNIFLEQYVLDICQQNEIKKYEIPQKVLLVPDFITGTEFITPKLSLKKERIFEKLQSEIEQVYQLEK